MTERRKGVWERWPSGEGEGWIAYRVDSIGTVALLRSPGSAMATGWTVAKIKVRVLRPEYHWVVDAEIPQRGASVRMSVRTEEVYDTCMGAWLAVEAHLRASNSELDRRQSEIDEARRCVEADMFNVQTMLHQCLRSHAEGDTP